MDLKLSRPVKAVEPRRYSLSASNLDAYAKLSEKKGFDGEAVAALATHSVFTFAPTDVEEQWLDDSSTPILDSDGLCKWLGERGHLDSNSAEFAVVTRAWSATGGDFVASRTEIQSLTLGARLLSLFDAGIGGTSATSDSVSFATSWTGRPYYRFDAKKYSLSKGDYKRLIDVENSPQSYRIDPEKSILLIEFSVSEMPQDVTYCTPFAPFLRVGGTDIDLNAATDIKTNKTHGKPLPTWTGRTAVLSRLPSSFGVCLFASCHEETGDIPTNKRDMYTTYDGEVQVDQASLELLWQKECGGKPQKDWGNRILVTGKEGTIQTWFTKTGSNSASEAPGTVKGILNVYVVPNFQKK